MRFKSIPIGFLAVLDEEVVEELVHDAYQGRGTRTEPTACLSCLGEHGHHSGDLPVPDRSISYPRGKQISNRVHSAAQSQAVSVPLKRIIREDSLSKSVVVSTTDMHLARNIGAAVSRVYQTEQTSLLPYTLRVIWRH